MAAGIQNLESTGTDADYAPRDASVGRDEDLQKLDACAADLIAGQGGLVSVTGPAGIGKTHLLVQFAKSLRLSGVAMASVGLEYHSPRPYVAWRQLLAGLTEQGITPQMDLTVAYRSVLSRLVSDDQSSDSTVRSLPPLAAEQARYRVYDAVREFLTSIAKYRPVVLFIDDLHCADESTLKLLRHLLPFVPSASVLLVVAFDSEDPGWSELSWLHAAIPGGLAFKHLVLGGLEHDAVMQLLVGASAEDEGSAHSREIARLTRGNPLHVQLLHQLIWGQDCERNRNDVGHALGDLHLVATSARRTLAQVIFAHLSIADRRILEVAAVVPDGFSAADVGSIAGVTPTDATAALERFVAKSLVAPVHSGAGTFRFRHPLFRRALRERMSPGRQVSLMESAIDLWSATGDEIAKSWQIAEWSRAITPSDRAKEGVRHCLRAAKDADHLGSPELKYACLGMAVELLDACGQSSFEILTGHALAAADTGAFDDASRSAWKAMDVLRGQDENHASSLDFLVSMAVDFHDRGAGEHIWGPFRDRALERLGELHDCRWARLRLLEGGGMHQISGPPLQVGKWTGLNPEAVRVARTQGNETDYCRTLFVYECFSVDQVNDLLEKARGWSSQANIARALSVAAETLMYRHGEFDRACELLKEQFAIHEKSGSIVEQAKSLVRLTMAQLAAGQLEVATKTREHARAMVERLGRGYLIYEHAGTTRGGDLYPEISMESNFAWYFEGDWLAVAEHWVQAVNLVEPGGSPVHIVEAAMAAQAFARLGRFGDARKYLDELTIVLGHLDPGDWAFNGAVGRASHAIWDLAAVEYAHDYHGFASRLLEEGVGDWTNTSLQQTLARMSALLGRHDEAVTCFEAARSRMDARELDPRCAIIDFDEAMAMRILRSRDDERRNALLQRALHTFEHRNMIGWADRATRELRASRW